MKWKRWVPTPGILIMLGLLCFSATVNLAISSNGVRLPGEFDRPNLWIDADFAAFDVQVAMAFAVTGLVLVVTGIVNLFPMRPPAMNEKRAKEFNSAVWIAGALVLLAFALLLKWVWELDQELKRSFPWG